MKKNRILVYVEGGNVQGIRADNPKGLEIIMFDVDNLTTPESGKSKDEVYKDWDKLSKGTKAIY